MAASVHLCVFVFVCQESKGAACSCKADYLVEVSGMCMVHVMCVSAGRGAVGSQECAAARADILVRAAGACARASGGEESLRKVLT